MYSIKSTIGMFVSLAAFAVAPIAVSAQVLSPAGHDFVEEGTAGPWKIYADLERRSCLIEGTDPEGNVVQMGLTADHALGYVGVFTRANVGLEPGTERDITIAVNDHLYSGKATMREHGISDGYQGGYFEANNPNFIHDLEAGQTLVAFADANGKGVIVDLTGSKDALEAAKACTQKVAAQ